MGPTSQRAGIIAAVELPVYDGFKRYFIEHNILDDAPPNHIMYVSLTLMLFRITSRRSQT